MFLTCLDCGWLVSPKISLRPLTVRLITLTCERGEAPPRGLPGKEMLCIAPGTHPGGPHPPSGFGSEALLDCRCGRTYLPESPCSEVPRNCTVMQRRERLPGHRRAWAGGCYWDTVLQNTDRYRNAAAPCCHPQPFCPQQRVDLTGSSMWQDATGRGWAEGGQLHSAPSGDARAARRRAPVRPGGSSGVLWCTLVYSFHRRERSGPDWPVGAQGPTRIDKLRHHRTPKLSAGGYHPHGPFCEHQWGPGSPTHALRGEHED